MKKFFPIMFMSAAMIFSASITGYSQDLGDVADKVVDTTKDAGKAVVKGTKKVAKKTKEGAVEVADKAEDVGDKAKEGVVEVADKTEDVGDQAKKVGRPIPQIGTTVGEKTWDGTKWVATKTWKGGKWIAEKTADGVKWVYHEAKGETKEIID